MDFFSPGFTGKSMSFMSKTNQKLLFDASILEIENLFQLNSGLFKQFSSKESGILILYRPAYMYMFMNIPSNSEYECYAIVNNPSIKESWTELLTPSEFTFK